MKNKVLGSVILIILVIIAVLNSYYFTVLYSQDEIWTYGFGVNIINGLVPYRDFNMVIGPIFPYVLSFILKIFGSKLIIYHIFVALMVVGITYLAFKKIKYYSLLIYLAMLIYSANGYNTSTLLWLFVLLYFLDKNTYKDSNGRDIEFNKYSGIIIPIIISIMALTKQTLGILIIPSLIYSKNKKKTIATYLTVFFVFLSYLIINDNLMEFLDYCILGLFDFADKNTLITPIYLILEILMVMVLLVKLIKSKFKRKDVCYVLLYQVIVLPIIELNHFVLGYSAFIYIIFQNKNIEEYIKKGMYISLIILEVYFIFITNTLFVIRDQDYYEYYPEDSYLKGRLVSNIMNEYVEEVNACISKYPDYNVYIFNYYSYFIKLNLNMSINKFDLINNGNMGYNGEVKYVEEINNYCKNNKCLFIINNNDLNTENYSQLSKKILKYVVDNNVKVYGTDIFSIYINGVNYE